MLTGSITDVLSIAVETLPLYYIYPWIFLNGTKTKVVRVQPTLSKNLQLSYTLLIPFRNEESRIQPLLSSLRELKFNGDLEVVFINDHSTDNSAPIISRFLPQIPHESRLVNCPEHCHGKKQALQWVIAELQSEAIFTIDADCHFDPHTLQYQATKFELETLNLLVSPVLFTANNSPLQQYQRLENTALVTMGLGKLISGTPTMANGANLLFRRSIFIDLNPFQNNLHVVGGDDIFLLEAIFKANPKKTGYSVNKAFSVYSPVLNSWKELWQQRLRWVRKTKHQQTPFTRNSQIHLALFYVLFWGIITLALCQEHAYLATALFAAKTILDGLILHHTFKFWKEPITIYQILVSSLVQSFFIPLLGIGQFFGKTHWKSRSFPAA